jgi:methanogen homoaconitase small subunit
MSRVWRFGSDCDTDQIVPGRFAPYMRPNEDVGDAAFIEVRPEFAKICKPGDIIVAGSNFGCGSSREYAVTALKRRQIGAIIALSYARIFFRNSINLGIPLFESPEIVEAVQDGEEVTLDIPNHCLIAGARIFQLPPLPKFAQEIVTAGGIVSYVKEHGRFPGEEAA